MKLPPAVLATRDRYVAMFPLWDTPGDPTAEDRARQWTLGLISQIVYEHPGQGYGSKRADPGRPLSKDAIAQQTETATSGAARATGKGKQAPATRTYLQLLGWDLLTGAGSGSPQLVPDPDSMDITGQVFEPVAGADVIGGAAIPVAPESGGSDAIPYNETYSIEFGHGCNEVYAECGAAIDAGMISVHSQRAAWDYYCGGLSWEDSYYKHINEFRAVYGLPPAA